MNNQYQEESFGKSILIAIIVMVFFYHLIEKPKHSRPVMREVAKAEVK
jgi:preprotein translocase subunit YajC